MSGLTVALVGGGRWGRTHGSILAQLSDRVGRVLWVSRHEREAVDAFLGNLPGARDRFTLVESLETALALSPDAAIVATRASEHAETVGTLLRASVPTLVEKPLALSVGTARGLVGLAAIRDVPLLVGLHLLTAPFLHHFLALSTGRSLAAVELEWQDSEQEIRHGIVKSTNLTTHKVDEIMPHLWSMLHLVNDCGKLQVDKVTPLGRGAVEVEIGMGGARATLRFGRRAPERRRRMRLEFRDGGYAELDFTIEPGLIILDGVQQATFESNSKFGPLGVELAGFLDMVRLRPDVSSFPQAASRCIGSVELAEAVRAQLLVEEARAVADRLARGRGMRDPDVLAWLVDNIAPLLDVREPRSGSARAELADMIIDALEAVTSSTHVQDRKLHSIIAVIRQSDFFGYLRQDRPD
ncbi:Gfo/Idh/MocA family oxidoreductase [Bradyrhizobium sp. PRIMUS42]|uniref:Gfo/Idh/MocA family oxidoreductase n=1 Tax=Bradyrhizobium sp. PRIMUS42 TaxID=2908926 RepID=UPI001FF41F05|nr:Gfo/Idh/MocA family oxidoreductase [Bradyrhizobium sp. PRIMUS42]MCJ9729391.1 Gfo/Idh/MocA family oxidoreductase [Bradyrhizobium sp. PRIMUS42]